VPAQPGKNPVVATGVNISRRGRTTECRCQIGLRMPRGRQHRLTGFDKSSGHNVVTTQARISSASLNGRLGRDVIVSVDS